MNRICRPIGLCIAVAGVLAVLVLAPSPLRAQEFFEVARDFVIDKSCDAYGSFKKQSDPTALEVGRMYPGRGVNRRNDPTHVFARVGDASKWIALSCGHFSDTKSAFPADMASSKPASRRGADVCLPFFDDVDNKEEIGFDNQRPPEMLDMSPPPPAASAFDNAITALCGVPGKAVTEGEFKSMLAIHPDVVDRIRQFTDGKVFPGRPQHTQSATYVADLAEAWFGNQGFNHIMCGEPSVAGRGKVGGMHFRARYRQLQDSGAICRMDNRAQNEAVAGVLYTMGVILKMPDGRDVRDARKGYGLTLDGEDLLKLATRAFAENGSKDGDKSACNLAVSDEGRNFSAVFVSRPAGIRTLYPDATPNGKRDKINPPCAAPVSLQ